MDTTHNQDDRWVERPWAARFVRVAVYAIPFALSIGASVTLTSMLATPMSATWSVLRWLLIVAVSTGVLVGTERLSRRLLPLATLFKLSLVFPDQVPSRFALALRIGTTSQLQQRIAAAQRGQIADSPGEAAEQLLELVGLLSHHDRLTRGHSERVRAYTHLVAVEMGISGDRLDRLRWSALLHDVGKIMIPGAILNKPGRLTDAEFDTIKTHPEEGCQLVEPLAEWLGDAVNAVWEHHERFDGGGYPQGLAGSEISLAARIVSVADSFDVMTSTRSYKKPMTASAARAELSRCAGTQFDPTVVRAFVAASIGTTQTATKPLALISQLFLFPRTFLANASAVLGVTAAVAVGAVAGTVGQTVAADRPATSLDGVVVDEAEVVLEPDGPASDGDRSSVPEAQDERSLPVLVSTTSPVVSTPADPAGAGTDPTGGAEPSTPGSAVTDGGDTGAPDNTIVTVPTIVEPPVTLPGTHVTVPPPTVVPPGTVVPPLTLPVVTIPPLTLPPITIPPLTLPPLVVTLPPVTIPPVTVPALTIPLVTLPPVTVPPVTVPPVTVTVTVPPVTVPPVTVPPVTVPPVTVPALVGVGGLL